MTTREMVAANADDESRPRIARPYGPADGTRFDHYCIGQKSIGKVNIDCTFLFKKSKWGLVGDSPGTTGGIIYLDLNFDQPPDCRIKHATISVTVDDTYDAAAFEHVRGELADASGRLPVQRRREIAMSPVQITAFGPRCITGEQQTKVVKKTVNFTPQLEAMGNGFGGVGIDNEETQLYTCRWWLKGRRQADESRVYKTVHWTLTENDLDTQATHSNVFKAAFAFAHQRQPVVLNVKIEAKLESKLEAATDRFKAGCRRLKTLGSRTDGTPKSTGTMIIFGRDMRWGESLRDLEENLEKTMELENYMVTPATMPGPQRVDFTAAPPSLMHPSISASQSTSTLAGIEGQNGSLPALPTTQTPNGVQLLQHEADVIELSDDVDSIISPNPIRPTPANLLRFASVGSQSMQDPDTSQDPANQMASTPSTTARNGSRRGRVSFDNLSDDSTLVGDSPDVGSDEMIQMVREFPIILTILRFLAWMGVFGSKPGVERSRKRHSETPPPHRVIPNSPATPTTVRVAEPS